MKNIISVREAAIKWWHSGELSFEDKFILILKHIKNGSDRDIYSLTNKEIEQIYLIQ